MENTHYWLKWDGPCNFLFFTPIRTVRHANWANCRSFIRVIKLTRLFIWFRILEIGFPFISIEVPSEAASLLHCQNAATDQSRVNARTQEHFTSNSARSRWRSTFQRTTRLPTVDINHSHAHYCRRKFPDGVGVLDAAGIVYWTPWTATVVRRRDPLPALKSS